MAVKTSIFQIDLRDDAFNAFLKKYNAYEKSLKSMPAAWAAVNAKINGSRSSFDALVEGMVAGNVQAKLMAKAQERADKLSQTTAERWSGMARHARSFAADVGRATTSLLKWGALTGVISGLLGAGGLFGIDRLALGVAAGRRSSLGLGVRYGEQRAFGANFGRLVDPDQFLAAVGAAQTDVTKRVGLIGGGLTSQQIGGSAADAGVALLRNLKRIADTTNPALYAQVLQARRLDQFASPEDLRRLHGTSRGEFESLIRSYGANRGAFDLPADVSRKWQEFTTQMARAGQGIENTFVRGLAPLAPGLTKLSESFEKVVRAFLSSPALEKWIKQVDVGLEKFAGYIGTDEFAKNVSSFIKGVGELAAGVGKVLQFFGFGSAADAGPAAATQRGVGGGAPATTGQGKFNGWMNYLTGTTPGVPATLLELVRRLETGGTRNPDAAVSRTGAIGRYQIEPGTARQYGFDPNRLHDPTYNEAAAKAILADLVRRYHGNVKEVLAGYNAGPGVANRYRASGDNTAMLPAETREYIERATRISPVIVRVDNQTGGNAVVSVNGLKN